jgi:hypothetical protein
MVHYEVCIFLALNFLAVRCIWGFTEGLRYTYKFYLDQEKQEGIVIGFKTKRNMDDEFDVHAAIIQYTAVDGKHYVIETEDYGQAKPKVGTKKVVCYEKEDPFNVIINPEQVIWWKGLLIVLSLITAIGIDVAWLL